jgi:hypothetical protein
VRSIAASEEGLVLGQVRRLLASPEMSARTIAPVQRERTAAEDSAPEDTQVIEARGALELRLLIERMSRRTASPSRCMPPGFNSFVAELASEQAADSEPSAGAPPTKPPHR